jgi:hypothetical protein
MSWVFLAVGVARLFCLALALDRQVAEQNGSRIEPRIGIPQEAHRLGFAIIGFWQWGQ